MIAAGTISDSATIRRQNVATGAFAECCLRAWAVLQLVRAYRDLDDAAGLRDLEAVLREKLPTWPVEIRVFVYRSLDAIHMGTPQPNAKPRTGSEARQ